MNERLGLQLTRDVSIKIDWQSFAEKFSKAATDGFKAFGGSVQSGIDSACALSELTKSISKDVPLGTRALELIILAFAWSFDALRASDHINEPEAKASAKSAIARLKQKVDTEELYIPLDFFELPTSATVYKFLRDEFLSMRQHYRASAREDEVALAARFDSTFRMAVWKLWSERSSALEELAQVLDSPALRAADFDRQWQAYRANLIHAFDVASVFGQAERSVSLGQLYVPLRCFWKVPKGNSADQLVQPLRDEGGHREYTYHVRLLDNELSAWLENGDADDWLRLIGGGPGSGKSTSAKAFAAKAAARDDIRPLYIPLQRLKGIEGRLRQSINSYFKDLSGCPFQVGPLERRYVEGGPRLLLVFDGLDEIARPGNSADEIARDVVDWVVDLYRELKGHSNLKHRILITGRMPSFQMACRRVGTRGHEALEVLNFLPVKQTPVEGTAEIISRDERPSWWARYSAAVGRPDSLPAGLRDLRLEGLTAEPLLCYLLALSGYLEDNAEEAAENRNKVYARLMHDVWARGWGGGRTGTASLSKDNFDRLFETMALAAWHGGEERVATHERFESALKITGAKDIYTDFLEQDGGNISNLAVNFYLKKSEVDTRGFEFTHKSFGEYLAARSLIRSAFAISELHSRRIDLVLPDWLEAVSDGTLSRELLTFLRDEARLVPPASAAACLQALEKAMKEVITNGFPLMALKCDTLRHVEVRQRKAETMLLAVINAYSEALKQEIGRGFLRNDDTFAIGDMLLRINQTRDGPRPHTQIFSRLHIPQGSCLFGRELIEFNFSGANFEGAYLSWAVMWGIKFEDANLSGATMTEAFLRDANLSRANLAGSSLSRAFLRDARCIGANFCGADLIEANIRGADLSQANLQKAKLKGADLRLANLRNANLEGASLEGADLRGADLQFAKLKGAKLRGADFNGAKLFGVDIDTSEIQNAILEKKPKTRKRLQVADFD